MVEHFSHASRSMTAVEHCELNRIKVNLRLQEKEDHLSRIWETQLTLSDRTSGSDCYTILLIVINTVFRRFSRALGSAS